MMKMSSQLKKSFKINFSYRKSIVLYLHDFFLTQFSVYKHYALWCLVWIQKKTWMQNSLFSSSSLSSKPACKKHNFFPPDLLKAFLFTFIIYTFYSIWKIRDGRKCNISSVTVRDYLQRGRIVVLVLKNKHRVYATMFTQRELATPAPTPANICSLLCLDGVIRGDPKLCFHHWLLFLRDPPYAEKQANNVAFA